MSGVNFEPNLAVALSEELLEVVLKYAGSMTLPTALGCLDMVKAQLIYDHMHDDESEDEGDD